MTYKEDLHNELVEKQIYYKRRINKRYDNQDDFQFFERGYYVTMELIDFLLQGNEIKTYAKYPGDFIKLISLGSCPALRYAVVTSKKYIHFKKGFYNKKNLTKYLLTQFNG